jgi:divalent metal cation (Fe/Co/Zn/Cd) transporter
VRHRRINDRVWIDAHLLFDGNLPLTEAHARSHAVEDRLDALFPDDRVHVNAHLEPLAHPHGDREPADALRDDAPQINER